jgi:peptide/nickel transport system substrate-binding protein
MLLLGVVLLLTACAGQAGQTTIEPTATPTLPAPEQARDDVLKLFYWQTPTILNPHLTTNLFDWDAARVTYEPLASFDKDGNLIPFLASEIPSLENGGVAEDGLSVTWQLKQNVKWSDGEPFTAADVRFTYEYITNSEVGATSTSTYDAVKSVEVIDDYTVKINFKEVNPAWSLPFVGVRGMILPRHIFEAYNGPNAAEAPANTLPVGTGPYKVTKFQTEAFLFLGSDLIETKKIVYEPNSYFWGEEEAPFSRVELKGGSDAEEAAFSVLEIGDFDFAWNLQNTEALAEMEAMGVGRLIVNPGPRIERILLNRTDPRRATADSEYSSLEYPNPLLSDLRVRQAINLSIDRQAITTLAGPASAPTSNNLVSPARYNSPNTSYEFNLEKAAALLNEAGWVDTDDDGFRDKDGQKLSLTFQTTVGNTLRQQIQEMVKENLGRIEVEVRLEVVNSGVFFGSDTTNPNHYRQFRVDMQLYREGNSSPDPGGYLSFWTCDQIPQKANNWSGENVERWCNSTYDALYKQSTREIDPEKREQLFIKMNDMLIDDVVMIPLINRGTISGISPTLAGVELTPWEAELWNIKDWRRRTSP